MAGGWLLLPHDLGTRHLVCSSVGVILNSSLRRISPVRGAAKPLSSRRQRNDCQKQRPKRGKRGPVPGRTASCSLSFPQCRGHWALDVWGGQGGIPEHGAKVRATGLLDLWTPPHPPLRGRQPRDHD